MDVERGRTVKGWHPRRLGKDPFPTDVNSNVLVVIFEVKKAFLTFTRGKNIVGFNTIQFTK